MTTSSYGRARARISGARPPASPGTEASPEAVDAPGDADDGFAVLDDASADIYLSVQSSPEFQEIRRRYRDFVFPMTFAFLAWYLAYVLASTSAPGFMGHRVAGDVNVALVFGLAQFASTFLIAWRYARNASRKRDRAALNLRWETQERFR